jgi:hypothetical protein
MEMTDIHRYARELKEADGSKALAEAAQRAVDFEKQGDDEQAKNWRRVEAALEEMQGPHQS